MRSPTLLCLAFLLLLTQSPSVYGAEKIWPLRQVTLILPTAADNEDERLYAALAQAFAERTKRDLTLSPMPGRSGADAWGLMDAVENNDGYTITAVSFPNLTLCGRKADSGVNRSAMAICSVSSYIPVALWVPASSPYTSLDGFIIQARKDTGNLLVAGNGAFTAGHLAWAALDRQAGVKTIYLPHMGSLEAGNTAANNRAQAFWADAAALPKLTDTFRPLAVAAEHRSPAFPNTPTFKELGYTIVSGTFRGIALPATTDNQTQEAVAAFFAGFQNTGSFQTAAAQLGFTLMDLRGAELTAFLDKLEKRAIEEADDYGLTQP